jgi:type I restriction enzyme S subunit
MKEGWEYSTIGDLCDKMNGLWKGKIGPFVNVGVIRNANFTKSFTLSFDNIEYLDVEAKQFKTRKLQKGDLIVEKSGGSEKQPVGRTVLFDKEDGEYSFSNFTSVLRIKDRTIISPEFLYKYILFVYLRGDTRKMQKATTGIHNIEFDKFLSIPVPKITLSEQQRIVDYLDSAFAKIDAMKANAEKSLNEAKALFQASLKEMLEPKEGWEEKILQDICSDIVDCPHTTPQKVGFPTQYPCIRTSELKGGRIDWSTMQYLDEDEYKKRVSRLVPKANDLVYGREGTYGDAVLLPDGYSFSLGQRTMLLRPNEIYIIPRFLLYSMISPHVYQQAKAKNSGCGVGHVNVKDIKVFRIGLPTIDIQQSIVDTLDSLKSKVDRLQENYNKISQECDALKQAILRQVFE